VDPERFYRSGENNIGSSSRKALIFGLGMTTMGFMKGRSAVKIHLKAGYEKVTGCIFGPEDIVSVLWGWMKKPKKVHMRTRETGRRTIRFV